MVENTSILMIVLTLLVSIGLPVVLTIYLYIKRRISIAAVLVGALAFFVVQVLVRIPALNVLAQTPIYRLMAQQPWFFGLFLGFTAGLFEEGGRWLSMRFLLYKRLSRKNALAYGVGHGGFEAIYLVGMTYVANLVYALAINSGRFDAVITPQLGAAAESVKLQLTSIPAYMFGLAGIERLSAIGIHIAFSLMVFVAVRDRRPGMFWLAVGLHTIVNAVLVWLQTSSLGIWAAIVWLILCGAGSLWYVLRFPRLEILVKSVGTRNEGLPAEIA